MKLYYFLTLVFVSAILSSCTGGGTATPGQQQARPGPGPTPPPAPVPTPPGPQPVAIASAPNYCRAVLSSAQANTLNQMVVDAYNNTMNHAPGFVRAPSNTKGEQPVVSFAKPNAPSLYFPQKPTLMHTTLCNNPASPFFQCSDAVVLSSASKNAQTTNGVKAYEDYYQAEMSHVTYGYNAPTEFGPLYVALPVTPTTVQNSNGQVVSGVLHVSLVKIWTSDPNNPETPQSRQLRQTFIAGLKQEFANHQALLPHSLNFTSIQCQP